MSDGRSYVMLGGLTEFQPELILDLYDNLEFVIRLLVAAAAGSLIGFERSRRLKEAGIRTHCIVALSAALFMILSKYAFIDVAELSLNKTDNARIAAQVVSGISFLGAGIIFKQGKSGVKGLTTAAGIWGTAAVGLAIGSGLYIVGISATLIMLVIQFTLHKHPAGSNPQYEYDVLIRMPDRADLHKDMEKFLNEKDCIIENTHVKKEDQDVEITLFVRTDHPFEHSDILAFMSEHPDIRELSI